MATKKAVRKGKKSGKLRSAKKMKEMKPLYSFGASNPVR